MDDLLSRWKKFDLTVKEDAEIDVRDKDKESLLSTSNVQVCVVAKVMVSKRVNSDAFKSVMKSVWKVHESTRIEGGW